MRISELSRASGVPTATIKFYLREGLLHSGQLTSATQAQYDQSHITRLRLIRALVGPARLSLATAKAVLDAVDRPPESPLELLGRASVALAGRSGVPEDAAARELVDQLGWQIESGTPALADLAAALQAIDEAQLQLIDGGVRRYAELIHQVAVDELSTVPTDTPESAVRQAVLGTVLIEPLLTALRRLALQDAAGRRFGPGR
ncbi:MerR family transcriptional regulator [Microlunatus sp. Gsoil 973]|uniref:MerR family transcriptional regulator n=1 Tax=Microlunatus sp. Gsoil 973 TaxID=2672569 RepID=UPI0012B4FB01|nr:MerR family transcriptional regulator [Microlunatus sp. Gsoil 973]QGN31545.1 MerR family transcriptional regulator [Microlunatus sp. Gsoil 973]